MMEKLGSHIKQIRGITYQRDEVQEVPAEGLVPIVKANNITINGFDDSLLIYIDRMRIKDEQFIRSGDILLAASSGSKKVIGKNIQFDVTYDGSFGAFCKVIRPLKSLHPKYLYHFFQTPYYRSFIEKSVQGANINNLKNEHVNDMLIPIIGFDDQVRIATLLSKVQSLIATRKNNLQQLDYFLRSTFLEMFGDPITNEKGWEEKTLGDIFNVKHGFAFKSQFFTEAGDYVLLTPGNFYEIGGYRDRADKQKYYAGDIPDGYILDKGDLLIAMTEQASGLLGSPILIPESDKYLHNQRLGRLVLKLSETNRSYLFHLFNTTSIRQIIHSKATGIKVRHTSPKKIESIKIGYPNIELQNRFGRISMKVELLKIFYQKNLAELNNLYGILSQKSFKGELNLSRVPLPKDAPKAHKSTLTDQTPLADEVCVVEYPMSVPEERTRLLRSCFDEFLKQYKGNNFSLDDFWQEVSFKTIDLLDEFDKPWSVEDYDQVKEWLFKMIREGKLEQSFVMSTLSPPDGLIELKIKG